MTQDAAPDPAEAKSSGPTPTGGTPAGETNETPVAVTFGPTVTIFFSDIRGFTEYTDERGDAAAFRMLQYHNSMVQEQIALYGGHIVKRLGDSFMVSFDAARNAMTCGIGIQKSLAQYNENEDGAKINIGIGINIGEPIRDADDFFGGSVNLAARICAAAGPGQILVSDGVRLIVGKIEGTDYVDRGHFELKGFHEPQHLYEVDWTGLGATASAPSSAPTGPSPTGATAAGLSDVAPARSSRRRWPIIAGAAALVLVLLGGGLLFLRATGQGPFAGAGAAKPGIAKPGQATEPSPGAANPVPGVSAPAAAASPAGQAVPAAKPAAAVQPSPAAQASPAAKPGTAAQASPAANSVAAAQGSPVPASGERLLRADDFSDPARGLFQNNVELPSRIIAENGTPVDYHVSYAYQNGAMVGRITGDHPGGNTPFSRSIAAADRVFDDFAMEVRGRITAAPGQTRFGIQYIPATNDAFIFTIFPATMTFIAIHNVNQQSQTLGNGRISALKPPAEDNLLRVEVRGDAARIFANGQEIGRVQHEMLARRGGPIAISVTASGQIPNRTAEVQFDDFKVFSLAP